VSPTIRRRALALAVTALVLALPAGAQATSTPAQITTAKTNSLTYLATLQQLDGRFATGVSSPELDWALSALAATGTAAADFKRPGGTDDARGYYRTLISPSTWPGGSPPVTDFERAALNAYAAGIDPARVSIGQNLLAKIYSSWQPASVGYWGTVGNFNGTVFALLALAGSKTTGGVQRVPQTILNKSIATVRANEHTDGGWNYSKAEGNPTTLASASDIDMTGATIASLCASGVANTDAAVVAGKNFLKGKLVAASGAFNSSFGANTDSNGWAVQGLNVCGFAPQGADFTSPSPNFKTPIDFLIAQQFTTAGAAFGGFKYLTTDTTPNAYASTDAIRALGGGGFTVTPPVPSVQAQWLASSAFSTTPGTPSTLAVSIDDGSGTLKVCSLSVAPAATTTTLGFVLDAALAGGSTPASCVTALTGTTTITAINGVANGGGSTWKVAIDGGTAVAATRAKLINLGDTIALRYGV
jgi:hypothetical protein